MAENKTTDTATTAKVTGEAKGGDAKQGEAAAANPNSGNPAPGNQSVPKPGVENPSAGPDPAQAKVGAAVPQGDTAKKTVPVSAPGGPNSETDANTQTYKAIGTDDVNTGPQPNAVREDAAAHNRTPTEQKAAQQLRGIEIAGRQGMPFSISGAGFGSSGTLTINGQAMPTTRWNDTSIKGQLPDNVQSGEVEVRPADGSPVQKGMFTRR